MHQNTLQICFCVIEVHPCVQSFLLNVDDVEEFGGEVLVFDLREEDLLALDVELDLPTVLSVLGYTIVLGASDALLIFFVFLLTYDNHFVWVDVLLVQEVHQGGSLLLVLLVKVFLNNLF